MKVSNKSQRMEVITKSSRSFKAGALAVEVYETPLELAVAAAAAAGRHLLETLALRGQARLILATGNSQIQFLDALADIPGVDWSRVVMFHLDEYLGIDPEHPASFRRYLGERVERRFKPGKFHYIHGDSSLPLVECERYTRLLLAQPIDLCCLGIGENGHLAFNDPAVADFCDPHALKLVKLDEACRMQQVGEGHFEGLQSVPEYALTLTIPALASARRMICVVPDERKAVAVRSALNGPVDEVCPASFLQRQGHCTLFLETGSARLLDH